jgi:hypothetical protein
MLPAVVQVKAPVGIKVIVPPVVEIGAGAVMVTMAAVPEIMVTGAVGATVAAEAIVPATAVLAIKPETSDVALATPKTGVTSVGLVANTKAPLPVSPVTAVAKLADEGVAKKAATLAPNPLIPVATGNPVQLVSVPDCGTPRIGVIKALLVNKFVIESCLVVVVAACTIGNTSALACPVATGNPEMAIVVIIDP